MAISEDNELDRPESLYARLKRELDSVRSELLTALTVAEQYKSYLVKIAKTIKTPASTGLSEMPMLVEDVMHGRQVLIEMNTEQTEATELQRQRAARAWTGLQNIFKIVSDDDCDESVALGMATSAVVKLKQQLKDAEHDLSVRPANPSAVFTGFVQDQVKIVQKKNEALTKQLELLIESKLTMSQLHDNAVKERKAAFELLYLVDCRAKCVEAVNPNLYAESGYLLKDAIDKIRAALLSYAEKRPMAITSILPLPLSTSALAAYELKRKLLEDVTNMYDKIREEQFERITFLHVIERLVKQERFVGVGEAVDEELRKLRFKLS